MGAVDGLLMKALGIDILMAETDVTWPVMAVFAASFGGFGWAVGRLSEVTDQLRLQQARLVESEKLASIGRMAAGVAHEVRNPLGVMRSSAELIAEGLPPEDLTDACRFIVEEVDRLDAFVGRVLDLSRPIPPSDRWEPCDRVVRRAATLAQEHLGEATVSIDTGEGQLPELFDRVLLGLFVNASQAGATRISVRGDPQLLRISDDGPGVPEELREQVFEPFFTTKARGTGLGLAMARRLVEAHGGRLSLGAGSTFLIHLGRE